MNYYVTLICGPLETRIGDRNLSARAAETKRDRLNEELSQRGVKYSECRYAMRLEHARMKAIGAAA